ncbi:MAG TPA: helicase-exonuclease AddAB subunit AddA, partial [Sedimentisphaerales bacterium]|nr:helicase-exonuclease AddAB subunit AddA [Sedimentisphaerales bacterium]
MPEWTPQQKIAINTRNRDVLVTASAGTGKTSVLAGRCLSMLSDPVSPIDVRQMLILTFTNAAAEEMRTRIAAELRNAYNSGGHERLKRQLMLLDAAHIGTIHSFCQKLLREHFYRLGLDPAFTVVDEDQQVLLKSLALEETIDWAWQQSNLAGPLHELLSGRNVRTKGYSFIEQVVRISNFLDGVADRRDWLNRAVAVNDLLDAASGDIRRMQAELILQRLHSCRQRLLFAVSLDQQLAGGCWSEAIRTRRIEPIDKCIALIEQGDIAGCAAVIGAFASTRQSFTNRLHNIPEEIKDQIHNPVKAAAKEFVQLARLAILDPQYADNIGPSVSRQTRVLIELVKRFDYLYGRARKRAKCLDFADLEHMSVQLLQNGDGPSDIAARLRQTYKAIFVDEYQDINSVQKRLITLLSAGRNVFAVGDTKQSIYAFRGAVPQIFLNDLAAAGDMAQDALRVDLAANFRSRQQVLDFVNAVFSRIMTAPVAGLDYDERAILRGGLTYEPLDESVRPIELHLIDGAARGGIGEECDESTTAVSFSPRDRFIAAQLQAAVAAVRIREMVGGSGRKAEFDIYDKDTRSSRPVEYRDIVILMRSLNNINDYAEILSLAGIPVHSQSTAGYFQTTEISDMLALLKVLDNSQRDIELAAVLRSPLFGTTDSELLELRLFGDGRPADSERSFHRCVTAYTEHGPAGELKDKLIQFLETLEQWRILAAREGIAPMLWKAYRQTGYLSFVAALPKGRQRRANLLDLHSRAVQFAAKSPLGGKKLATFVEFIEKLIDEGGDYRPADVIAPGENAVRIMSVHKSKGLEFPVVFLAGMERRFNSRDMSADCLFDESTTLGLSIIDARSNTRRRSMAGEIIAARKMSAAIAEEMRILYVALTRARERLILTATQGLDNCRAILRSAAGAPAGPLPAWMLSSCRSSLEWLLCGLSNSREVHTLLATGAEMPAMTDSNLLSVRIVGADEQDDLARQCEAMKKKHRTGIPIVKDPAAAQTTKLAEAAVSSLLWRYPFQATTEISAKTSVTQFTHRGDEWLRHDLSGSLSRVPHVLSTGPGIEPRIIGTAAHVIIQNLDIAGPCDEKAVKDTVDRFVASGMVAAAAARAVDPAAIAAFFQTEIGAL